MGARAGRSTWGSVPRMPKAITRRALPRVPGSRRESRAGLACWPEQVRELRARADGAGVTVSRYLNELLWRDWIAQAERPRRTIPFRRRA